MLLDIFNIQRLRRIFIYLGFILAALLVQNSILDKITILGARAMFLPVVAVAIGFFEGGVWGVSLGLVLGLLTDISFSSNVTFTILMPLMGFASGILTQFFLTKRFVAFLIISLCALVLGAVFQSFTLVAISGAGVVSVLLTGAKQVLWSVPMIFAVFYPCRALSQLDLSK